MILYNIRANGPFEYDKMILNIGQIHNEYNRTKHIYRASNLDKTLNDLDDTIKTCTASDNLLNQIALLKKAVTL